MSYPVSFEADYTEHRNRLTVFFRLILAIPLAIWLYLYALAALIVTVIAWFAIVITASYPQGMFRFVADFVRFIARFTGYAALLCDPYPSFLGSDDPAYPVRMQFEPLPHYNRLKTLFRIILAIPILILRYVMQLLLEIGAIAAWFVILITGRMPRGLFDVMVLANSYIARSDAYVTLLSETYPPFQDQQTRSAGLAGGPASQIPAPAAGTLPPSAAPSGSPAGAPAGQPAQAPPAQAPPAQAPPAQAPPGAPPAAQELPPDTPPIPPPASGPSSKGPPMPPRTGEDPSSPES
jgi:Domain of unknown function (DUF4389)